MSPEIVSIWMVAFFFEHQFREKTSSGKKAARENVAPPGTLWRVAVATLLALITPVKEDDHKAKNDGCCIEPAREAVEMGANSETEHANCVEEGNPSIGKVGNAENSRPDLE